MTKPISMKVYLKDLKTGKEITGVIKIEDGIAVTVFNDKTIANKLFINEFNHGNTNVKFDVSANALIEKFPTLTSTEIYNKIKGQLERSGGKAL